VSATCALTLQKAVAMLTQAALSCLQAWTGKHMHMHMYMHACMHMRMHMHTCLRRFLCSGGLLWMKETHSWRMSPALYSCRVRMSPIRDALNIRCCTLGSRLGPT
jgi:hypothetical protein